jgi:glycosyltransferase involved in cell wall biosynthesis
VVTIGAICGAYLDRKGLTTFARASRLLPDARFVLIGTHVEPAAVSLLQDLGGPNLTLPGYLPESDLKHVLRESSVYAQLSLHEGFGYAVAEAMLSGCTPVVTACGALPEVVGDSGLVVPPQDPAAAALAIADALSNQRVRPRARIAARFALDSRRDQLHALVASLCPR